MAARVLTLDGYLVPYLLEWAGLGVKVKQPWGAGYSMAMEVAHGYGLTIGDNDPRLTALGIGVALRLYGKENAK